MAIRLSAHRQKGECLPYSYHSFTEIKGYPLQNRKIYDNMFLYVLIYCYGDFHAEKISDCISGFHGASD